MEFSIIFFQHLSRLSVLSNLEECLLFILNQIGWSSARNNFQFADPLHRLWFTCTGDWVLLSLKEHSSFFVFTFLSLAIPSFLFCYFKKCWRFSQHYSVLFPPNDSLVHYRLQHFITFKLTIVHLQNIFQQLYAYLTLRFHKSTQLDNSLMSFFSPAKKTKFILYSFHAPCTIPRVFLFLFITLIQLLPSASCYNTGHNMIPLFIQNEQTPQHQPLRYVRMRLNHFQDTSK